jgi:glutathione-regulated potassium-efflux system ancillary protein KefG
MNPTQRKFFRILILFAHPALHKSQVNRHLIAAAETVEGVTVRDLYEIYPDYLIDVKAEQELLVAHDIIILHHPFYWYSAPSLVKEWLDLVLEHGWAYGDGANALQGKYLMQTVTCGGSAEIYCSSGRNLHSVREFLLPFEQSARLCGLTYLAPFVVHGTGNLKEAAAVLPHAHSYVAVLAALRDGRIDLARAATLSCLNANLDTLIETPLLP